MKTKIFSLLLGAAALSGLSACSDDWTPDNGASGKGKLSTESIGVEVDGAETVVNENSGAKQSPLRAKAATSSRATVTLDNFIVTVTDNNGQPVEQWTYSTMPELPVFPVGDYKVVVKSHNVEPAAWNAPYYEGEQAFAITDGNVTEVETVVCKLANIRVSVAFTEGLLKAFDNPDEVTVKITSEGNNSLTFTPAETRSGYFEALANLETLRIDFSASISGHTETFTKTIDNVAKGQHRKITFGLTGNPALPPEELGVITNDGNGITVDTNVIEDEPIETDYPWFEDNIDDSGRPGDENFDDEGGDEPDPPTPPIEEDVIEFESTTLVLDGPNDATQFPSDGSRPAQVDILSTKGIAHLEVNIISNSLNDDLLGDPAIGLGTYFDLAYPGAMEPALSGTFHFPVGNDVIGQNKVTFDITPFVGLLNIYPGETHTFKITVTDQDNNVKVQNLVFNS